MTCVGTASGAVAWAERQASWIIEDDYLVSAVEGRAARMAALEGARAAFGTSVKTSAVAASGLSGCSG